MRDITVLFVDDERSALNSLEYNLVREPYKKIFAQSPEEGFNILAREPVHVVVSDMRMPGMDGLTFLLKVKNTHPDIARVILSAFTDAAQIISAINSGEILRYITKPIEDPAIFRKTIREAIDYYLLRRDRDELVARLRDKNQECETALAQVKRLQGLIPICCYCKRIRNDQNFWEDVERYVSEHSDARFSHGICPNCMKQHVEPMLVDTAKDHKHS